MDKERCRQGRFALSYLGRRKPCSLALQGSMTGEPHSTRNTKKVFFSRHRSRDAFLRDAVVVIVAIEDMRVTNPPLECSS